MLLLFQDNFILVEAAPSSFFRITTSTNQLLFWGSYFFRMAAVFSFFRTITFSQELFFQNNFFFGGKILQSNHFLRTRGSLQQLLFGTAIFSKERFRIKISKKATFSEQEFLHSINLFRKAMFWKTLIFQKINFRITYFFWRAVFLEQLLFQNTLPSIVATFFTTEELLFYNIPFQNSYYFTATVPFRSHTFHLFLSN